MRYSLHVKTKPPVRAVSLAEAKAHLRVDVDDENVLIEALLQAAEEWAENYCRRSFVQRTLELRMDCFPAEIRLPRGPVISVTHVKYTDAGGSVATMDAAGYQVDTYSVPPRIVPVFGGTWPTPKVGSLNAVLVEYEAGYAPSGSPTNADNVPLAVKAAIKLIVGHLFEHRELVAERALHEVPFAVKHLLAAFEVRDFTLE